ncbi:hypothetical protein DRE_04376 [Drechslerella stenobrocha 248]|uniref:FAD-binding FR-type domain-containing protein n=1 Tax=Drechslerella stenobrocha 248 TaxID=1043628 RepID=W7I279_9PEZI|nr:hypothetical protein DRE_04376 [Drechslerella stenobrocha 248]
MAVVFGFGGFHPGEVNVQRLLHVPNQDNPTVPFLHPGVARFISASKLVAIGTTSPSGHPWTSLLAGAPGFAQGVGSGLLAIQTVIPAGDPIYENLGEKGWGEVEDGLAKGEGMVAGLAVDLEKRLRVKFYGRSGREMRRANKRAVGLVMEVEQTLWNCPKYMNARQLDIVAAEPPEPVAESTTLSASLPQEALDLISRSDMFFVSSRNGYTDMDTNHRGGPPGFVRVLPPSDPAADEPTTLVWPEYSGNRLYQTLGNLQVTPLAGLTFPDYNTGDILYTTGTVEILIGDAAEAVLNRSKLAIKYTVTEARYSKAALGVRFAQAEQVKWSPYNPMVRYLATEGKGHKLAGQTGMVARLVKKEKITDSIAKFRFQLEGGKGTDEQIWRAGQYVMLNFEEEMSAGYRHMDDSDPQGLNDDYVRSFTVSSPPGRFQGREAGQFEITIRKVGSVTRYLFQQNAGAAFEAPIQGFGGEFFIEKCEGGKVGIVAAGVGITPFIAQWGELMKAGLDVKLFWTVRGEDVPFVRGLLEREDMQGMKEALRLFVTGRGEGDEAIDISAGEVQYRRMQKEDLLDTEDVDTARKWYVCTGRKMLKEVQDWLQGRPVSWEEFTY